jgi:3-(3-hydroxy-phenyl)propionate hydroxylase
VSAKRPWPVVIIGAGPTGAMAGIELGMRGVPCLVLDRWEEVYAQPRAVHLDDELYRAIARIGIGPEFAAVSRPGGGLRLVDRQLRVLGEFARDGVSPANGYPRANMFDQPELEALLRARLDELKSVTFRGGVIVTSVEQHAAGRVSVCFRDPATESDETIEAEVVLGCDGANSLVREAIGASMQDLGFEQRWLVVDVATDANLRHWEGVHQVCDTSRAATYMRIGETRYRWEFQLLDHESVSDYDSLERLEPLLRPWLGATETHELRLTRAAEYTFRAAIADRWRKDRIFLLGDAAHLTPPFIGQGMGAGVRDAVNLAWKVEGFLSGALPHEVLDSYEPERSSHARSMIRLARLLGVCMTRGGRIGDALRRAVVPALSLSPLARRQISDSTTPPLAGSSWIDRRRHSSLAGHLCPNPVIDGRRLDEIVGTGWALITAEVPAASDAEILAARDCVVIEAATLSELAGWLRDGQAVAALVRPDRTVLASGADVAALCATVSTLLAPRAELLA